VRIDKYIAHDFGYAFLQDIVDFVSEHLEIDDVFNEDDIKQFIEIGDFVEVNCKPGDVFDVATLEQWALENGFIEKEE